MCRAFVVYKNPLKFQPLRMEYSEQISSVMMMSSKWKHFPRYWSFVHKDQWRGALMFSLIGAWTNHWVNNREAGDLRRHRAHNDVIVIFTHGTRDIARKLAQYYTCWCLGPLALPGHQLHTLIFQEDTLALQWRHNGRNGVSNLQPHDCLLNCLFSRRSKKISKLCVTGLCTGNSLATGEFPAQRASNAEKVSIWWRYHEYLMYPVNVKEIYKMQVLLYSSAKWFSAKVLM